MPSGGGLGRATSRACPPGQAPEARSRKALDSRKRLPAGNGERMKPFACSARGPQGTALVAAPSRGSYRRPQGRHEVKSPRHLKLRWRSSDLSDGGERVARVPLWRLGCPGRSAGCQRRRPVCVWSRESGVNVETRRLPLEEGGHGPSVRLLSGRRNAQHPSCSHDKDFRHGRPVPRGWERHWLQWVRR